MSPRLDRLGRMLRRRELRVCLDEATELRLRAYADRMNREFARHGDTELWDLDSDADLAEALLNAAEGGIEANEKAHGLVGSISGELLSRDVYDAGRPARDAKLRRTTDELRGSEPPEIPAQDS